VGSAQFGPSADCTICLRAHWPSGAGVRACNSPDYTRDSGSLLPLSPILEVSNPAVPADLMKTVPLPPSVECRRQAIGLGDAEFQSPEPNSQRWMEGFLFLHGFGFPPIATSTLKHLAAFSKTMRLWRPQRSKAENCLRDSPETRRSRLPGDAKAQILFSKDQDSMSLPS
jgi:hypothetical protein